MAKGTQTIQFLRNGAPISTVGLTAAKAVINAQLSNAKFLDGSPIVARYKETANSEELKTLLGIKHSVDGATGVTFYTDEATIESMIQSYVGTGVTTANTVTSQLQALSGNNLSVSGDTSVEGAKRYADEIVADEASARSSADTALSGAISGLTAVVDGDRVTGGTAISATSAAAGTNVSVLVDDSTIKVNGNNQLYVASTGLTPYTGANAIEVTPAGQGETANTISLKIDTADQVLSQSTSGLLSTLSLDIVEGTGADSGKTFINLCGKGGTGDVISQVDASQFVVDGFLESVTYDDTTKDLVFTWNTDAGVTTTTINLGDLIDTYDAASGVTKVTTGTNPTFVGVVDNTSETVTTGQGATANVLTVGADGFKVSNIQNAIDYKYGLATGYTETVSGELASAITDAQTAAEEYASGQDASLKSELEGEINASKTVVTGSNHINVTTAYTNGSSANGVTYTVTDSGLATSGELEAEETARETADTNLYNIIGETAGASAYTPDTNAHYISAATDLEDADSKLDAAIYDISGTVASGITGGSFNGTDQTVQNKKLVISVDATQTSLSTGYTPAANVGQVTTADTVESAIGKLDKKSTQNAQDLADETSARTDADTALENKINSAKTYVEEDSDFLSVATAATSTGVTYTISTSGIASASDLQTVSGNLATVSGNLNTVSGNLETVSGNLNTVSGKADTNAGLIAAMSGTASVNSGKYITSITQSSGAVSIGQADLNASAVAFDHTPAAVSSMTATTVQGAVEELQSEIDDLNSASELTLWHAGSEVQDHKVLVDGSDYTLKQGNDTVAIFNIAQDMVVSAGTVITADGTEKKGHGSSAPSAGLTSGDTYVKLEIANGDENSDYIYIPANKLVDVYTANNSGTTVDVTIDGYNISADLKANSVSASNIVDSAVTTSKIADSAVTTAKIANSAVTTDKIADNNVTSAKLSSDVQNAIDASVTGVADSDTIDMDLNSRTISANVKSASISASHLADDAVTSGKIADGAVTSGKIADSAVTTAKILDGNVTSAKLSSDLQNKIQSALTNVVVNGVTGTVNNSIASVTVSGDNINLGGDYATQVANASVSGAPATGDTVNQALAKLYKSISANEVVNGDTTTVSTTQGGQTKVEVNIDQESIVTATTTGDTTVLAVGVVDCGQY